MAAVTVFGLALWACREPVLRAAGWALVVEDPLRPAEVIVIGADADAAGVLEAADLVQTGIARRVAVFGDPPDAVDQEFLRRGVPYEDRAARSTRQLISLGVTAVEQIGRVSGTEAEARVLPGWCDRHQVRSLVFVTSRDHSRRLRRVLQRSMRGGPITVIVRPSRYSTFDPDGWWRTRDDIRTEIIELQKLLLDVIRHPLS